MKNNMMDNEKKSQNINLLLKKDIKPRGVLFIYWHLILISRSKFIFSDDGEFIVKYYQIILFTLYFFFKFGKRNNLHVDL